MSMQQVKEAIRLERRAGTGRSRAVVEGSMTLPGGLRETAHVLFADASATVDRAAPQQDKVNVTGRVTFRAIYTQGTEEKICAVEASSDFAHTMEMAGVSPQCVCRVRARVDKVSANVSGGQMSLRAELILSGYALLSQPVEALTGLSGVSELEISTQELTSVRTTASGADETMVREEFDLPAGLEIRETLFATAEAQVDEVTGGAGRAGVSGQIRLTAYHTSALADMPIVVTHHTMAFSQGVELAGEEGDRLLAEAVLRDVAVASQDTAEGRTLRAEAVIGLVARSEREEKLTLLSDAYTAAGEGVALEKTQVSYRTGESSAHAAESGKTLLILPEGSPAVRSVLCAFAGASVTQSRMAGNRLVTEGTMTVTLIAVRQEGGAPVGVVLSVPFRQTFAVQADPGDELDVTVSDIDASVITGDRIELRYVMQLTSEGVRTAEAELVSAASPVEAAPAAPSIILYYVQPDETLWDIAKRFRVPVRDIRRLNPELSETLAPAQGLVIWHR